MTHPMLKNRPLHPVVREKLKIATCSTIFARLDVNAEAYKHGRILHAAQLAVDNAVVLEIGMNGTGKPADNHPVGAMHR